MKRIAVDFGDALILPPYLFQDSLPKKGGQYKKREEGVKPTFLPTSSVKVRRDQTNYGTLTAAPPAFTII